MGNDSPKKSQTTQQHSKQMEVVPNPVGTAEPPQGAALQSKEGAESSAEASTSLSPSQASGNNPVQSLTLAHHNLAKRMHHLRTRPSEPVQAVGEPNWWCVVGMFDIYLDTIRQNAQNKSVRPYMH
ncbi:hypothetical protein H5410_060340 [Solanum commersonii]|uniref:Uncharacterized protein n=1 Tax=Solanum commersonii TaxID=4109 RepID=A0A9J5W695_SOLCO|nr:hypothetical protein H5410_060340 [Solanum commersonii]